jgi:hypothetical protein
MSGCTEKSHGSDSPAEDHAREGTPDLAAQRRLEDPSNDAGKETTGIGSESSAEMDEVALDNLLKGLEEVEKLKAELMSNMALLRSRLAVKTKVMAELGDKSGPVASQSDKSGPSDEQSYKSRPVIEQASPGKENDIAQRSEGEGSTDSERDSLKSQEDGSR